MTAESRAPRNQVVTDASIGTAPPARSWFNLQTLLLALAVAALFSFLGYWWGVQKGSAPAEDSAEAGFARDMATHHAQAVNMAGLVRDGSDDPEIRQVALDIMLTQQAQIGQMQGWLAVWHLANTSMAPAMTWMGMPTTGPMPGMASPQELNRLANLTGVEADGLFLQLMIPHHRAGVIMAQAVLEHTQRPEVRNLAQAIINAQKNEITYMQELLQRKGFPPVPDMPAMDHENMAN